MAINSRRYALILLFFICLAPVLEAQSGGYFIDPDSEETRFIQRLAWSGGENALRYEVIIEREVNGSYQSHLREFTTALFINVSLAPGEYRFRVIPYDILDRPSEGSRWMPIIVRLALQPELFDFTQDFVYGENDPVLILSIDGNNLVPGAEVYLLDEEGARFFPNEIDSADINNIRLFFDSAYLQSGEYEIIVRNPGGLEAGMGGISIVFPQPEPEPEPELEPEPQIEPEPEPETEVEPEPEIEAEIEPELEAVIEPGPEEMPETRKPFLINISAAFTPVLPVYGESSGEGLSFTTGMAGISFIAAVPANLYIGVEIIGIAYLTNGDPDVGITLGVNLLTQKRLPNGITGFNFRLGAGYALQSGNDNFDINMGASFFVNILKYFYAEAGLDYVHSAIGSLRPRLGIGLQF